MSYLINVRSKAMAIGLALLASLILALAISPASSRAYTVSNYCNNTTLESFQYCEGVSRTMYAVEGWGDQHSVCVYVEGYYGEWYRMCSGGPGEHVYDSFGNFTGKPGIQNHASGTNVVHGRAYQP